MQRKERPVSRPEEGRAIESAMGEFEEGVLTVATDGGAKEGAASIGIAITADVNAREEGEENVRTVHESAGGEDRSSYHSELQALTRVAKAAAKAGKDMRLIVDNQAVVWSMASMLGNRLQLPKYCWQQWLEVEEALRDRSHTVDWCPSHGKKEGWEPQGAMDGAWMRRLNAKADAEATKGLELDRLARDLEKQWEENRKADDFAEEMLGRQYRGLRRYCERYGLDGRLKYFERKEKHPQG